MPDTPDPPGTPGARDGPATPDGSAERTPASVGTEPVAEVLRESGIVPTEAGKARWRAALGRPIPAAALAEGRRRLAEARSESRGTAT
jgi:hypothetical protein